MATTNKAQRVAFAGLSVIAVLATAACGGGDKAT